MTLDAAELPSPAQAVAAAMDSLRIEDEQAREATPQCPSPDTDTPPLTTPSGTPFKSRYGPSANPKVVAPFTFGQRLLSDTDSIWDYNAWDHATPDPAYLAHMAAQLTTQKTNPVTPFDKKRFHSHPDKFWNKFYTNNTINFFKDRKWLGQEFPLLATSCTPDAPPTRLLEVGAGAGNTLFPVLKQNQNPGFHMTAADFSAVSVSLIRAQPEFAANYPAHVDAVVWDLADPDPAHLPCPPGSLDGIILIFVFSALAPWQWRTAVANVKSMLKPGGTVLFRDYGRGDLAQVRMKGGRWLGENFYVRGDGTRVYFFEQGELREIFEERWAGLGLERWEVERRAAEEGAVVGAWGGRLEGEEGVAEGGGGGDEGSSIEAEAEAEVKPPHESEILPSTTSSPLSISRPPSPQPQLQPQPTLPPPPPSNPNEGILRVTKIGTDRRMLVNRKRQLKMYRCWLQMQCEKEVGGEVEGGVDVDVEGDVDVDVGEVRAGGG